MDNEEDCPICLNPLNNFEPTLETRCKVIKAHLRVIFVF